MAERREVSFVLEFLFVVYVFVLPGVASKICAPVDRDISVLKDQKYWQFEVPHGIGGCNPFKPEGANSSTCLFYFSICHPVPRYCPDDSGICLADKVSFDVNHTLYSEFRSIGSFRDEFKTEVNSFSLQFGLGEPVPGPLPFEETSTTLIFKCAPNATWSESGDFNVPFPPNITYTEAGLTRQYVIVFNYTKACKGGGGGGGGGGEEGPAHALSVGSILLILFFPGIFLYCVVGAMINKGAGKTGKELIPNSKFWSDLPGLIADGFSFFIAKITCSGMSTTRETYNRM